MAEYDSIKVKDQLGRPEDKGFFVKRPRDEVIVEDGPCYITSVGIGNSFIIGHPTNGVIGTANAVNGQQIVIGEANRGTIITKVVNAFNMFREHFVNTYFKDSTYTTADWASVDESLKLTNGEIAQSSEIVYNDGTISFATIYLNYNSEDDTYLTLQMTADGTNWETVTSDTEHSFTNTGTDLRFRITHKGGVVEFDSTTGWGVAGGTLSTNTSTYYDRETTDSTSFNFIKSGTSVNYIVGAEEFASQVDATGSTVFLSIYIADAATLALLRASIALEFLLGNSFTNNYKMTKNAADFSTGWNHFSWDLASQSTNGSPDITTIDYWRITFYTTNASSTWTSGKVCVDSGVISVGPWVDIKEVRVKYR